MASFGEEEGRRESVRDRYHVISGLQAGCDRGALLGVDAARLAFLKEADRVTTGGFAPLGFKCDDYIQASEIDSTPEASASIEAEREYIVGEIDASVRDLIGRFGVVELADERHKVKFDRKDKANA